VYGPSITLKKNGWSFDQRHRGQEKRFNAMETRGKRRRTLRRRRGSFRRPRKGLLSIPTYRTKAVLKKELNRGGGEDFPSGGGKESLVGNVCKGRNEEGSTEKTQKWDTHNKNKKEGRGKARRRDAQRSKVEVKGQKKSTRFKM